MPYIKTPSPDVFVGHDWATNNDASDKWDTWKIACQSGLVHFHRMFRDSNYGVVLDRSFPDEYAYSKVLHPRTFDEPLMRHNDGLFAEVGFVWIWMWPDKEVYEILVQEEEVVKYDKELYDRIQTAFHDFSNFTKMPTIIANWKSPFDEIVGYVNNAHQNFPNGFSGSRSQVATITS